MGEAKKRREATTQGKPVQYRDFMTGELEWGRAAPSVQRLRQSLIELNEAEARGERPASKVPCNGCTACCHMEKIDFDLTRERPEDLAHLDYEPDPERPGHALMRRENNACVHLGPQGCTVYQHRPRCCRVFDCRIMAYTGLIEKYADGSTWPMWIPEEHTEADRFFVGALRAAAMMEVSKWQAEGKEISTSEIAGIAWLRAPEFVGAMVEVKRVYDQYPPEMQKAIASEAEEQTREHLSALQRGLK